MVGFLVFLAAVVGLAFVLGGRDRGGCGAAAILIRSVLAAFLVITVLVVALSLLILLAVTLVLARLVFRFLIVLVRLFTERL